MPARIKYGLLIGVTLIGLFFCPVRISYGEMINYIYDELSRLIRVDYGNGMVIEYIYDKAGNRTAKIVDTTSPTGTITINSGATYTNSANVTLTLTCSDDASGCSEMKFSNDNGTGPYSDPEAYSTTRPGWQLSSGDGTKAVYAKFMDAVDNWSDAYSDTIILDATAPGTTAVPFGGTYNPPLSVTLICNDGAGSGCDRIYYTTDGTTPTTSSPVYSSAIIISVTTTLKFFAKDLAGNSEAIKTEVYNINMGPVMIGSTSYSTIQAAYDAAVNGNVIKCRDLTFIENLIVYRNVSVTLEGGYDSTFTTNYGIMTTLRGMIITSVGGGTLTIKNFTLTQ